ncbi:MAG: hypothetical protein WC343_08310 [Bacilli bacterium]
MIEQSPQLKGIVHMEFIFGSDAINAAGIAALGYPGAWITDGDEARTMQSWLLHNQRNQAASQSQSQLQP